MFGRLTLATLGMLIVLTATCAAPQADAAVEPSDGGVAAAADSPDPALPDLTSPDLASLAPVVVKSSMELIDWVVVGGYFALLLGIAVWVIRKSKDTADDYFLAGRNLGWFVVGASIFASNIGAEHLVGLAGSGCTDGVAMAHYELMAWCLLVLAWVLVPFYSRSMVFTMPEFLEKRFSPTARWVLSIISLVAYALTKVAVGIFAGGIVFETLLPELHLELGPMVLNSFWLGSILVIVLTGVYTVLGGLRAVAYTETLQTVVLVLGSALVTIFGLIALGDGDGLVEGCDQLREVCGSEMFNLWKPLVPDGVESTWAPVMDVTIDEETNAKSGVMAWYFNNNYPWLGMLFCAPIIGLWYWCTDQYIVQRALAAPNEREARRGSIWAAFLKMLPVFIFIIPGMICFALTLKTQSGNEVKLGEDTVSFERMLKYESYLTQPDLMREYSDCVTTETNSINGKEVATAKISWEKVQEDPAKFQALRAEIRAMRQAELLAKYDQFVVEKDGQRQLDLARMASDAPRQYEVLRADVKGNIRDGGMSFPMLVTTVLPPGVRGLVVAGLLAALMSSLAGVFNASATLFTMDFYSKIRPNVSQHRLVWIGRIATVVMVLIGLAWIPVIQGGRGLYDYLQSVQGYLAPPIFVVFFLGVAMKRLNSKGCLAALLIGFLLGVFRLTVDTPVKMKWFGVDAAGKAIGYEEGSLLWIVNNTYFQYYSLLIFLVSVFVMIGVSLVTKPPSLDKLRGLTYGTVTDEHRRESRSSWNWVDVTTSVVVCLAMLAAYLYFQG